MEEIICQCCGNKFTLTRHHKAGKYCSLSCYHKKQTSDINRPCLYCGRETPHNKHILQYCSRECWKSFVKENKKSKKEINKKYNARQAKELSDHYVKSVIAHRLGIKENDKEIIEWERIRLSILREQRKTLRMLDEIKKNTLPKFCLVCGRGFPFNKYKQGQIYCSKECYWKASRYNQKLRKEVLKNESNCEDVSREQRKNGEDY